MTKDEAAFFSGMGTREKVRWNMKNFLVVLVVVFPVRVLEEDDDDDARMDVCRYNRDDFVNDGTTNASPLRLWTTAAVVERGRVLRQAYILWGVYPLKRLEGKRRIRCYAEDV